MTVLDGVGASLLHLAMFVLLDVFFPRLSSFRLFAVMPLDVGSSSIDVRGSGWRSARAMTSVEYDA